ncbi:phenylacetate-CoA oxygenase subunit PaaJ [bacterium]|nr:phenylacetate-CoA oxygenase subunit PaaJ [bacterium]
MVERTQTVPSNADILAVLAEVFDPEIPTLSVLDLGIVREVEASASKIKVKITPTYSGCPAMQMIENDIKQALGTKYTLPIQVDVVLAPAWTTEWLTEKGRAGLKASAIAPPDKLVTLGKQTPACPYCNSRETEKTSEFGSTACKSFYRCKACLQPFDYFKEL